MSFTSCLWGQVHSSTSPYTPFINLGCSLRKMHCPPHPLLAPPNYAILSLRPHKAPCQNPQHHHRPLTVQPPKKRCHNSHKSQSHNRSLLEQSSKGLTSKQRSSHPLELIRTYIKYTNFHPNITPLATPAPSYHKNQRQCVSHQATMPACTPSQNDHYRSAIVFR